MGQRSRRRHRTGTYHGRNRLADPKIILLESNLRGYFRRRRTRSLYRHSVQVLESWTVRFPFRRQIPIPSPSRPLARANGIPLLPSPERSPQLPVPEPLETSNELRHLHTLQPEGIEAREYQRAIAKSALT